MNISQSNFVNELGNTIHVSVEKTINEVIIKIVGPTSMCENILTHNEAKVLLADLTNVLS